MAVYVPYPRYKSSGNSWLGDIPEHWTIRRSDFVVDTNRKQVSAESLNDTEVIHYSIPNVQKYGAGIVESGDKVDSAKLLISEEQLLVSKLNPRKATLCIAKPDEGYMVIASSEFVPILPAKADLRYAYYLWGADKITKLLSSMVQSVTRSHQRVNPSDILKLHWAWPTQEEQKAIARFLDFKTAQIDALIAKKQALLEKLAEKRTALISHAVTKGLDPSVPMRDSGVEWLGEIPAHWDIWKVTHGFGKIGSGTTPKSDNPLFYDGEIPWVTTSELRESVIFDTAQKVTGEAVAMHSALKVYPAGSLAIAMYGATIGRLGILGVDATFNQACCVFSDPLVFDTQFVYYWLWMRRPILISLSNGGGQPNLSQDDLKKLWIPIPDLNEQRGIVRFLDIKTSVVDEQVKKVEEVIARLSEYRSALITNAVTGKIDVRDFPIPDPVTKELCDA